MTTMSGRIRRRCLRAVGNLRDQRTSRTRGFGVMDGFRHLGQGGEVHFQLRQVADGDFRGNLHAVAHLRVREGIGLLPYSALSMGVLTGKYLGGAKPAGARFTIFERNVDRYNPPRAQDAIAAYVALAKKYAIEPAALAIAFAASRAYTTSVILGATSVEQLQVDMSAADLVLTPDIRADIEAIYNQYPDPTA